MHIPNILLLFLRFKRAYEQKDVQKMKDTISEEFYSDVYGGTKERFIDLMRSNLNKLIYGLYPCLTIDVLNISSNTETHFSVVLDMKATLKFLGIPTSHWDSDKLVCEAKIEGTYNYWRITKLVRFRD